MASMMILSASPHIPCPRGIEPAIPSCPVPPSLPVPGDPTTANHAFSGCGVRTRRIRSGDAAFDADGGLAPGQKVTLAITHADGSTATVTVTVARTRDRRSLMPVMAVSKFERFFRRAASLDIDKSDIKRYADFVQQIIDDLLLMGVAAAKANDRDIVEPWDLPITKGLQENIHAFRKLDAETGLEDVLERLATW